MTFLDKETELLLEECIENSSEYPRVLAEKFKGLSAIDDRRLRSRIHALIEGGYISKLQWAGNVPWLGSITEKGYSYFHDKEVYIRSRLKKQSGFKLLDKQSEETLQSLLEHGDAPIVVSPTDEEREIYKNMALFGYLDLGTQGLPRNTSGEYIGMISVTPKGKRYFSDKEKHTEEILAMDADSVTPIAMPKKQALRKTIETKVQKTALDSNKLTFHGILGFDCGEVEPYFGSVKYLQEKGFVVSNGIPTLRGFARISDLAKASKAKYEEYQRKKDEAHIEKIAAFLQNGKAEAKFLPEVVLSVTDPGKVVLTKYSHSSFDKASATVRGTIENMDYYTLDVEEGALSRVDGNHRLEAGKNKDYYVPFSIIVWGLDEGNENNLISVGNEASNLESEAFLFYILNNTARKLEAEENFKGLVKSETWTDDELALINKHLPLLKHFDRTYARNKLLDKRFLSAPLSQTCEILTEINDQDFTIEEFDIVFWDAMKLLAQFDTFAYCEKEFPKICYQLAFYTRYKSVNYEMALNNFKLVNNWLQKYKYTGETFTRASKIYDVAYRFITSSPKTVFMAMEYKSEEIVADYNGALQRAVHTLNNMGGNIELEAYPIMTGKGKSFSITADIYKKIEDCAIFIADTTEANPNVMYELGIAYDKKKPIILVREKGKRIKVPSDIISEYYYSFEGMTQLEKLFVDHIQAILISDYGAVYSD